MSLRHPAPFRLSPLFGTATLLIAGLGLSACGGGGGGSSQSNATPATYSGTITGLGSIVVNGVRFSTLNASAFDPETGAGYAQALELGSSVTVEGRIDGVSGQATRIVVHGGARGVAGTVDPTNKTFIVAGQTVKVDANTLFDDGLTLTALAATPTPRVEVHGFVDQNNVLLATRVERTSDSRTYGYAVLGRVSRVLTDTFEVKLSDSLTLTVPTPNGVTLALGVAVRVLSTVDPATATLTAANSKVLVKGERQLTGRTKLRGTVTSTSPLTVNDVPVTVDTTTAFDDGLTAGTLRVGQIVKVEGTMVDGVLRAREIEPDEREYRAGSVEDRIKLYGAVSAVSGNTFVVQGVTLTRAVGVTAPSAGAYVEVKARMVDGVLTAHSVTSAGRNSQSRFETYGTASCPNGLDDLRGTGFTLTTSQGGTLTVNGQVAREVKYDDDVRTPSGSTCFLEVEGNLDNGVIQAREIEVKRRY